MCDCLCLQLKRERFIEELESYTKQAEEFQTFGDMSDIQRYLKKAQALDTKLQAASDKVNHNLIFFFQICYPFFFKIFFIVARL